VDDFKKSCSTALGKGGVKCFCCNDYHTWGNHQKKLKGLSKLGRTRLKEQLRKEIKIATKT